MADPAFDHVFHDRHRAMAPIRVQNGIVENIPKRALHLAMCEHLSREQIMQDMRVDSVTLTHLIGARVFIEYCLHEALSPNAPLPPWLRWPDKQDFLWWRRVKGERYAFRSDADLREAVFQEL